MQESRLPAGKIDAAVTAVERENVKTGEASGVIVIHKQA